MVGVSALKTSIKISKQIFNFSFIRILCICMVKVKVTSSFIIIFVHKYCVTTLLGLIFIFYSPIYITIFLLKLVQLVIKYVWVKKYKKYTFAVVTNFCLPETNKWYDLLIYFLIYTPIYFATKTFTIIWQNKIKWSSLSLIILGIVWVFTLFTGIPSIVFKIIKYWHILILTYLDDSKQFGDKYYYIHSIFFFK